MLIDALAGFEELPAPDAYARERLEADGWGDRPRFEAWLACADGLPVGYAIIFETYSTFLARPTLYLEDLFVLPEFRGQGAGRALFDHISDVALERGCGRMEWACLDWNTNAQAFYAKVGARQMAEWLPYRLTAEQILAYRTGSAAADGEGG